MSGDIMIFLIVFVLGIMVGLNHRGFKNSDYKKQLMKEIDTEMSQELTVAKNLNESLTEDVKELKLELRKYKK